MKLHSNKILLIAILGGLMALMMFGIRYTSLDFDAAMNFQISYNLSENGAYMSNYVDPGYNGTTSTKFDHKIQTGSTVIVPTAILNMIFGADGTNMQIVTVFYFCILMVLIFVLVSKEVNWYLGIAAICVLAPMIIDNAYNGFGETTTFLFMVLTFILFDEAHKHSSQRLYFFTGVVVGLGYLTKTVFLICLASFLVVFVFEIFILKKYNYIKNYIIIVIGAFCPVLLFEMYKLYELGVVEYIDWWKFERGLISSESGVTDNLGEELTVLTKIFNNLKGYSQCYEIHILLIPVIYLIPGAIGFYYFIKNKELSLVNLCLYGVSGAYLLWWLLLVPTTRLWERRDLIGNSIIIILTIIYVGKLFKEFWEQSEKGINKVLLPALYICMVFICINNIVDLKTVIQNNYKQKQLAQETAEELEKLQTDAEIYGTGWWQNPVVAMMSEKQIKNLDIAKDITENSFFVADIYINALATDTLAQVKSKYYLKKIFGNEQNTIYSLYDNRSKSIMESGNYVQVIFQSDYEGYMGVGNTVENERIYVNSDQQEVLIPISNIGKEIELTLENYNEAMISISSVKVVKDDVESVFVFSGVNAKDVKVKNAVVESENSNDVLKLYPQNEKVKILFEVSHFVQYD